MKLRERIARLLCPELVRNSDRYFYLNASVREAYRWLGEFPDAADVALWLSEQDYNHWRKIGEPSVNSLPWNISNLRERMRRRAKVGA